jgi:hypothetical protein
MPSCQYRRRREAQPSAIAREKRVAISELGIACFAEQIPRLLEKLFPV